MGQKEIVRIALYVREEGGSQEGMDFISVGDALRFVAIPLLLYPFRPTIVQETTVIV